MFITLSFIKKLLIVISIGGFIVNCSSVPEQSVNHPSNISNTTNSNLNALYKAKESLNKAKRAKNSRKIKSFAVIARKQAKTAIKQAQNILEKAENLLKKAQTGTVKRLSPAQKRQRDKALPHLQAPQQKLEISKLKSRLAQWVTGKNGYLTVTLQDYLFETEQTELSPTATPHIKTLASFLNQHPQLWIRIEGHTDNRSSYQHNLGVSERRATSVKFALMQQGINSKRIVVKGFGETRSIANNNTEAGRRKNNRVEVVILKATEPEVQVIPSYSPQNY
jgi:outer membrane protein OmpA-like peptidoglycan-associated protein